MMKFLRSTFMLILVLEFDVHFLQHKPKRTSSSSPLRDGKLFVQSFSPSSMLISSRRILLIQPRSTNFYYKNHYSSHHRVLSSIFSSIDSIDDSSSDDENNDDPPNNNDVIQDHADHSSSSSNTSDQELLDWIFSEEFGGILGSTEDSIIISTTSKKNGHGKRRRRRRRRGVYVTKYFPAGSIIFQIPLSSALIIEEMETTDAERGAKLLEILFSSESEANNSKWQIYRNSLPTRNEHFDSTPDFWTDEQIRQLEFPRLVHAVLQRKKRIENVAMDSNANEFFLQQLQFATWLTESRSLTLVKEPYRDCPEDELQTTSIMIPLVDMINHECHTPNSELQVIDSDDDDDDDGTLSYAVVAVDDIKAGEEITISYGTGEESTVELLQYYGFVPESNEYDMDMLSSCLEEEDDDCLIRHDEWSTTLDDDEERLKELLSHQQSQDEKDSRKVERTILEFRIRMKHAWNELQEEWERDDDEDEEYDDDDDDD